MQKYDTNLSPVIKIFIGFLTAGYKTGTTIGNRKRAYPTDVTRDSVPVPLSLSEEEKERLVKETSNRIVQGEVWVLGTLAHLGYLAE